MLTAPTTAAISNVFVLICCLCLFSDYRVRDQFRQKQPQSQPLFSIFLGAVFPCYFSFFIVQSSFPEFYRAFFAEMVCAAANFA